MLQSKLLIIPLFLILTACQTAPPVIKVVTNRVEVPIAVPCTQEAPPIPDFCFEKIALDSDIYIQVRCLLSDRKLSKGYEVDLLAKFNACK